MRRDEVGAPTDVLLDLQQLLELIVTLHGVVAVPRGEGDQLQSAWGQGSLFKSVTYPHLPETFVWSRCRMDPSSRKMVVMFCGGY